jgi:hypothetical protein
MLRVVVKWARDEQGPTLVDLRSTLDLRWLRSVEVQHLGGKRKAI